MAYFEDLQPCTAVPGEWRNLLAVGWLSRDHEFTRGAFDREFLDDAMRGEYRVPGVGSFVRKCELCSGADLPRTEAGLLFIEGNGVMYVAPRLIRHYVQKHGYRPPPAFISALPAGALYGPAFKEAIARHLVIEAPAAPEPQRTAYGTEGIQVLEGIEPVRIRPGMYFGGTGARALTELLWEIVGNSLDEHLAGAATRISIDIDPSGWITVEDDGRGIDPELFDVVFTSLHSGATLDGHHPHVHLRTGLMGAGVGPSNALCASLEVETRRNGQAYLATYSCGRVVDRVTSLGPTEKRGTVLRFLPDDEIFRDGVQLDLVALEHRLDEIAWMCPKLDIRLQGRSLQHADGLRGWVRHLAPDVVKETVLSAVGTENDVEVDVVLGWRPRSSEPLIRAFANYAETNEPNSSNRKGLVLAVNEFIRTKRASREKKVMSGLVAVVHVGLLHPRFGGPTRARLEMKEAQMAVQRVVTRAINQAPWWWDRLHTALG